jgi:hypothetical protein
VTRFERLAPELQRYDAFLEQLIPGARARRLLAHRRADYGGTLGVHAGRPAAPYPLAQAATGGA